MVSCETRHLPCRLLRWRGEIVSKGGRGGSGMEGRAEYLETTDTSKTWKVRRIERLSSSLQQKTMAKHPYFLTFLPSFHSFSLSHLYLCSLFFSKRLPLLVLSFALLLALPSSLLSLEWCEHQHSVCEMSFPLCLPTRRPRWGDTRDIRSQRESASVFLRVVFRCRCEVPSISTLCPFFAPTKPIVHRPSSSAPRHSRAISSLSLLPSFLPRFLHIFPVAAKAASFATLSLGGGGGGGGEGSSRQVAASVVVVGSLALNGNSFHSEESSGGGSFRPYNAE